MTTDNSHKSILKGISAFGGVQMIQIVVSLLRGKIVSVILGATGMGISALFNSSALTIQQLSSLGLNLAFVKDIAEKRDNEDSLRTAMIVAKRLILITSLLGAAICIVGSPFLSRATFGDYSYAWQFVLLGLSVFFAVGAAGKLSLLQGLHDVKRISKTSIIGALTGLFAGVPLYYFFGNLGIVPAICLISLSTYISNSIFLNRHSVAKGGKFIWQSHKPLVRRLVSTGIILMVSALLGTFATYLLQLCLRYYGDLETVGLYQGANSLTSQYSAMFFTALALDYLPRLMNVAPDNQRMNEAVNRQSEIILLMAAPLASLFIAAAPVAIYLLLSEEFMSIVPLVRYLGFAILLRAMMYPMGYISLAKDNRRLFFWLEGVLGNVLTLGLGIFFFVNFGIVGLGFSAITDCLLCYFIYYIVNRRLYGYRISSNVARYTLYALVVGMATLGVSFINNTAVEIPLFIVIIGGSFIFTIIILRRLVVR